MTRRLQDQAWYYGLCSRQMVEALVDKKERGDFIVRATQDGEKFGLAINMKNDRGVDNFAVVYTKDDYYSLPAATKEGKGKKFRTAVELVEYYKIHTLPNRLRLRKGIVRPQWLIAPQQVSYKRENILSTGHFNSVYRGTVKQSSAAEKSVCAVKVPHTKNEKGLTESSDRKRVLNEVAIQTVYRHQNIVAMIGVVLDCPPMMMVMEMCNGGRLEKHLQKRGTRIGSFEKQLYCFDVAMGMQFLHNKNIIHRDLSARNCLIGFDGCVKIDSFGRSVITTDVEALNSNMESGLLPWLAPECLPGAMRTFSTATDVWAYGVLVSEVFSNGAKPFADCETATVEQWIQRAEMPALPPETPEMVQTLLKDIWQKESNQRPDCATILKRLGAALKAQKSPPAVTELVLNELPVKRDRYPDFDWNEDKESFIEMIKECPDDPDVKALIEIVKKVQMERQQTSHLSR